MDNSVENRTARNERRIIAWGVVVLAGIMTIVTLVLMQAG